MLVKTILNRVEPHKAFVYSQVKLIDSGSSSTLEINIEPRANSRPTCSGCGRQGPGYDRLPMRRFEFIPLWGSPCSSSTPCAEWTAHAAASPSSGSPGPTARTI